MTLEKLLEWYAKENPAPDGLIDPALTVDIYQDGSCSLSWIGEKRQIERQIDDPARSYLVRRALMPDVRDLDTLRRNLENVALNLGRDDLVETKTDSRALSSAHDIFDVKELYKDEGIRIVEIKDHLFKFESLNFLRVIYFFSITGWSLIATPDKSDYDEHALESLAYNFARALNAG